MPFAQRIINYTAALLGWMLVMISIAAMAALMPPTSLLLMVAFSSTTPVIVLAGFAGVTLLLGIALIAAATRERKGIVRHGYCTMCGYDLRSSPRLGCPECGWGR